LFTPAEVVARIDRAGDPLAPVLRRRQSLAYASVRKTSGKYGGERR